MDNLIFPLSKKEAEKNRLPYSSVVNRNAVFPKRLRKLRKAMGISQIKLANEIGVTKSTISLYEQGDNVPDIKTFVKIADFYNVSYDYLLGKTDSTRRENIDIAEKIGLNDEAIINLLELKKPPIESLSKASFELSVINNLFMDKLLLFDFTHSILSYTYATKSLNIDKELIEAGELDPNDIVLRNSTADSMAREFLNPEIKKMFVLSKINEELEWQEWVLSKSIHKIALNIANKLIKNDELKA